MPLTSLHCWVYHQVLTHEEADSGDVNCNSLVLKLIIITVKPSEYYMNTEFASP